MLGQFFLECRCHGNTVEHGVDRDARETLLFFQRNPKFVEGLQDFRVDLVEAVQLLFLFGRCIV